MSEAGFNESCPPAVSDTECKQMKFPFTGAIDLYTEYDTKEETQ